MRKIGILYSGSSHQYRTFTEPKYAKYITRLIYLPRYTKEDLEGLDVLLVSSQLHQGMVTAIMPDIHQFLASGKVVMALGSQHNNWFSGHGWEHRPTNFWWWREPNPKSGLVVDDEHHPLFSHMTLSDATWHYHGVFKPERAVKSVISVENEGSIFYIDDDYYGGTLILTTLDPEYHYGSYFMPATEKFLDGMLPWLATGTLNV